LRERGEGAGEFSASGEGDGERGHGQGEAVGAGGGVNGHAAGGGDTGAFLGALDGGEEAAELVHQPDLLGLEPGPYPALRRLVELGVFSLSGGRGLLDEDMIDGLHLLFHFGAELGRERAVVGDHVGVLAAGHAVLVDADLVVESLQVDLAADDADGSGQGGGAGHDVVGGHGDVVAPGRGHVGHGYDDGLFLFEALDLAPDEVGMDGGAAGRVNAEHDGRDGVVLSDAGDGAAQRVGAGGAVGGAVVSALSGVDGAGGGDEGEGLELAPGVADGGARPVELAEAVERDSVDDDAEPFFDVVVELVLVHELVYESGVFGFLGEPGPFVNEAPYPFLGHASSHGDGLEPVAVDGIEQGLDGLAVLVGHSGAQERLDGGLVFSGLEELGLDVELVEYLLEVHDLGEQAGEVEGHAGGGDDAVA